MSDRHILIKMVVGPAVDGTVELYLDGESGTWRLFLRDGVCVDFSLAGLRYFHEELGRVIRDIASDPDTYNAEVRREWDAI